MRKTEWNGHSNSRKIDFLSSCEGTCFLTSLSPAFLESHLLCLTRILLKDQSKDVLSKLVANATGSVRCQFHVNQTLYTCTSCTVTRHFANAWRSDCVPRKTKWRTYSSQRSLTLERVWRPRSNELRCWRSTSWRARDSATKWRRRFRRRWKSCVVRMIFAAWWRCRSRYL